MNKKTGLLVWSAFRCYKLKTFAEKYSLQSNLVQRHGKNKYTFYYESPQITSNKFTGWGSCGVQDIIKGAVSVNKQTRLHFIGVKRKISGVFFLNFAAYRHVNNEMSAYCSQWLRQKLCRIKAYSVQFFKDLGVSLVWGLCGMHAGKQTRMYDQACSSVL